MNQTAQNCFPGFAILKLEALLIKIEANLLHLPLKSTTEGFRESGVWNRISL